MKKTTKADKFNTQKFDKRIKITSNHALVLNVGTKLKVDGAVYRVVNTLFNYKKTFVVYLKFVKFQYKLSDK